MTSTLRRQKILKFSGENLVEFFLRLQKGEKFEVSGLPEDSRFVTGKWNQETATLDLLVESQEFEDLPGFAVAPEVIVTFKQVVDP